MDTNASQSGDISEPSPGFPCAVCGKVFEKKKSQIRHSSYCRKRARCPPRPRKRSCVGCTKAKCHCDSVTPACARCVKRGFVCLYQLSRPQLNRLEEHSQVTTLSSDQSSFLSPILNPTSDDNPKEMAFPDAEAFQPTDDFLFQSQALFDDIHSSAIQECVHEREYISPALLRRPQTTPVNSSPSDQRYRTDSSDFGAFCSSLFQPILRNARSFKPRTVKYWQLSLNRKFVICTLSAYPQMLLPGKDPPPFLHPQCIFKEAGQDEGGLQISPLGRCSGIVALWSVKNKNNTAFVWRSIRAEQERISEECHLYNDWTALAALQAVCIYFILRVSEQDEDVTDFDIPLIVTMIKLSMKLRDISLRHSRPPFDRPPSWERWLLAESLQRTIFIIFMVDFLFDISAGAINGCDASKYLVKMRLPCSKNLWKSKTRSKWEEEYVGQTNLQCQSQPTFLDLIWHDEAVGTIERWMAEVDELGMLVMSAASLADEVEFGLGRRGG